MIMAPKIWDVVCESKRIIYTQPHHYLTLSLIFLLPLSFFSLIFQLTLKHLQQQQQPPTSPTIITSLSLLFLLSSIFTYCAFITITYSAYHSFSNRPVKLKEAIESISTSFFPLLATDIVIFVISFFVFFLFGLLAGVVMFLIIYLGDIDLTSHPYFIVLCFTLVLLPLMYLLVNLSLVKVIVVVEAVWGLESLRRSWKLVKGTKRLILSTSSLFVSLQMMLVWITGYSWVLILVISPILAMFSLYNIVALTVLYISCKEKHGELEDEEFGKEKDEANLPLIP